MKDLKRLIRLIFGLYLCGLGTYLAVRANIGLSPWDAFAAGLSLRTGMLFGDAMVLSGFMVLAVDLLMREPIGLGTILNTMLIGKFADLMAWLSPVPYMESLLAGVPVLQLTCGDVSAFTLGELFYFFQLSCGISAYMLGVNPFDQPGVEFYKRNMFQLLGKPGVK